MRGYSLGWFRGVEYAKYGRIVFYRFLFFRKKVVIRRFFFTVSGAVVVRLRFWFFVFSVLSVCYSRTVNFYYTDAGLGRFF